MLQGDAPPLRRWLDGAAGPPRYFWGARKSVAFTDLLAGSSFGGRLGAFQGRSVLVATRDQLTAALAMIELDGIAGRIVICPPGLPQDHLRAIVATAEVDAIVTDCGSPDTGAPIPARSASRFTSNAARRSSRSTIRKTCCSGAAGRPNGCC